MILFLYTLMIFASTIFCQTTQKIELNPNLFSFQVQEFTDLLIRKGEIQEYIWNNFISVPLGKEEEFMIDQFQDVVEQQFVNYIQSLEFLIDSISLSSDISQFQGCCDNEGKEYDNRFRDQVLLSHLCNHFSPSASLNASILSPDFDAAAKNNLAARTNLRWQYFGSVDGVLSIFPGVCVPSDYDPRTRVFYQLARTGVRKRLVILLDSSKSMNDDFVDGHSKFSVAKTAALALLEPLNVLDSVAVIAFNNRAGTFRTSSSRDGGCYANYFSYASEQNKKVLSDYITSVQAKGASYLLKGLSKAVSFFLNNDLYRQSDDIHAVLDSNDTLVNVIYILTDGRVEIDTSEFFNVFQQFSIHLNVLVNIVDPEDIQLFQSADFKSIPNVVFLNQPLTSIRNIPQQVFNFFDRLFELPKKGSVFITPPYLDTIDLSHILTLSSPTYNLNDEFLGVVAIDVPLDEIFVDLLNYRPNDLSYAFIMNNYGWLIYHPMLLHDIYHGAVANTYFDAFEPVNDEFMDLLLQLKSSGRTSIKQITNSKIYSAGEANKYGVFNRTVTYSYVARKIDIVDFYIIIVSSGGTYNISKSISPDLSSFLYHNFATQPPAKPCSHLNVLATKEKSSVFLSRRSFIDTEHFFARQFSQENLDRLIKNIDDSKEKFIKKSSQRDIIATEIAQEVWTRQESADLQTHVAWRYIGTDSGIYRVFPGIQVPDNFDPVLSPWYQMAYAYPTIMNLSPPFKHLETGAPVVLISSALFFERERNYTEESKIFGVVGIAVLYPGSYGLFVNTYPDCQKESFKCLVIDIGGYVVLAEEYLDYASFTTAKHLSEIEPQITHVLIEQGVLIRITCSDVLLGKIRHTYRMKTDGKPFWGTFGQGYFDFFAFKLYSIPGTNAYIIIRSLTSSACVNQYYCPCPEQNNDCITSWDSFHCECPCPSYNHAYNICGNQYTKERSLPCPPTLTLFDPIVSGYDLSNYETCYDLRIHQYSDTGFDEVTESLIITSIVLFSIVIIWAVYYSRQLAATLDEFLRYRKQLHHQKVVASLAEDLLLYYRKNKAGDDNHTSAKIGATVKKHLRHAQKRS